MSLSLLIASLSGGTTTTTPSDPVFPDPTAPTLHDRLTPTAGGLKLQALSGWESDQVLESSFFKDSDGTVKIYYTGSSDVSGPSFDNRIGLATATDIAGTWTRYSTDARIGQGYGGAPTGRRAHSSWIGKLGATYYAFCLNGYGYNYSGEDRNIYLYTSTDGITWTAGGMAFDHSALAGVSGFGNTAIVTNSYGTPQLINGKYVAYVEAFTSNGYWEIFRAEATALNGTWTFTGKMATLQAVSGAMYGGACVIYSGSAFHCFYHYGSTSGNLPTYLAYASSSDGVTWVVKEAPFMQIGAQPFPNTDQIADPYLCEINGRTYMTAEYVQNSPTYKGELRLWSFDGTFAQLIKGL